MDVSVIIPTYNMGRFLPRAVSSVRSQTQKPLELIIVDDGSTDDTREIIDTLSKFTARSGITLVAISQLHKSKSAASNVGISVARGDAITLLDADDILPGRSIELRTKYLEEHPGKDAVFTDTNYVDARGLVYHKRKPYTDDPRKLTLSFLSAWKAPFHPMSVMYRKRAFDMAGSFDVENSRAEDSDLAYRMLTRCSVGYLPEPAYTYFTSTHDLKERMSNRMRCVRDRAKMIKTYSNGSFKAYLYAELFLASALKLAHELVTSKR